MTRALPGRTRPGLIEASSRRDICGRGELSRSALPGRTRPGLIEASSGLACPRRQLTAALPGRTRPGLIEACIALTMGASFGSVLFRGVRAPASLKHVVLSDMHDFHVLRTSSGAYAPRPH